MLIFFRSGNGSTEMSEFNNVTTNAETNVNSTTTRRPLQQIYHNKADEDSNTVKQVIVIKVFIPDFYYFSVTLIKYQNL